ncbi:ArnT family glycosyltransferase [Paenibacillus maysiensis]|uniref:ArnT family glycosyltransferase n=1 Tax=Paenibacillus maysiensis TaxID=1155954 RepID=UPI0004711AC7|nr:glycosyltransferase family 39 protein [Paenibacillus maysiensis]
MILKKHGKTLLLFACIAALELAVGIYFAWYLGYMHTDALSRVANAFYVLYSRDPHLGAIGFVWNPLPSLMELVVLLFYPLFPVLASHGLAAVMVSSLFAGASAALLYGTGKQLGLHGGISLLIALLFSLNPFMFLFGFNGLSDSPYIFFILLTVSRFCMWLKDRKAAHLIVSGFALALAFWVRYEAVPLGVAMALGVLLTVLFLHGRRIAKDTNTKELSISERLYKVEATWLLLLLPIIFSGLLWIFFNWIIMGDPLYFLRSEYSNATQSAALLEDQRFAAMFAHPALMLQFIGQRTSWYAAPLIAILLVRLLDKRLFSWSTLTLLAIFLSVPGLQFLLMLKQSSFGWFRYFMYVFPITVAWVPYELSLMKGKMRGVGVSMVTAGMLITAGLLSYALSNPAIAADEHSYLTHSGNESYDRQLIERKIAPWLDEHYSSSLILTDSYAAYPIILSSRIPKKFMITSDYDFGKSLTDLPASKVDYVLVTRVVKGVPLDQVNRSYPDLFEKGAPWASLVRDFSGQWRLYKVEHDTELR